MKRLSASAAVLAAILLVAGLGASLTQAARLDTKRARPTLRLVKANPTVVAGKNFRDGESVRVTLSLPNKQKSRRVRASAQGSFVTTLDAPIVGRCSAARVMAVGDAGSRASLKPLPLPGCLPVLHP